jgi:hypothetical protein
VHKCKYGGCRNPGLIMAFGYCVIHHGIINRCKYHHNGTTCNRVSQNYTDYCHEHTCTVINCMNCVINNQTALCYDHAIQCAHDQCDAFFFNDKIHTFCLMHRCKWIEFDCLNDISENDVFNLHCESHHLIYLFRKYEFSE